MQKANMRKAILALGAGALFVVPSLHAEIYQCDGKWTNRPCEGAIERTMHESSGDEVEIDPAEALQNNAEEKKEISTGDPLAPRYSISRKLKKLSKDLMQKYQIGLSKEELRAFEAQCIETGVTIAQCQSKYDEVAQRLNAKVEEKKKNQRN